MSRVVTVARLARFLDKVKTLIENAIASHTHNNNIIVQHTNSPYVRLTVKDATCETRVYKNASTTADYGTTIADYDNDGARDSLILCRNNALANKAYLSVENDDGTRSIYYLFGEHHKPTAAEVGALPADGDVDIAGVLRVQGNQAYYFAPSTKSQTLGTNNATGGTTVCCGSSADMNLNGANVKTANVLPRANNNFTLGNTTYRWKGIYSTTAVNVSSDARLKHGICPLDTERLAEFVQKLHVVEYNYKDDPRGAHTRIGLIAQNVQEADAEVAKFFVSEGEDGMLNLRPADLVFPLIAAVQELSARVDQLSAKLN